MTMCVCGCFGLFWNRVFVAHIVLCKVSVCGVKRANNSVIRRLFLVYFSSHI